MLHLNGSTLEGGGQLVRNALALSVLTGQPMRITNIRGNRNGKKGLKQSHSAAIGFLLEVCGGIARGNQVGSSELAFYPGGEEQRRLVHEREMGREKDVKWKKMSKKGENSGDKGKGKGVEAELEEDVIPSVRLLGLDSAGFSSRRVRTEYNIRLSTPGSIFLIFQALYPYLLYAGACSQNPQEATAETAVQGNNELISNTASNIRLMITGGTNVSFSPSYDYVSQVLIPTFAKLGLPPLSVELERRGWAGIRAKNLGVVCFIITPLKPADGQRMGQQFDKKGDINQDGVAETIPAKAGKFEIGQGTGPLIDHQPFFPAIKIQGLNRGFITKVDVTILAPDTLVHQQMSSSARSKGIKSKIPRNKKEKGMTRYEEYHSYNDPWAGFDSGTEESEHDESMVTTATTTSSMETPQTIRQLFERYAMKSLSHALKVQQHKHGNSRTTSVRQEGNDSLEPEPAINLHTSEATHHYSHTYILLVAHTSTGFRLGHDVLYSSFDGKSEPERGESVNNKQRSGVSKTKSPGKNKGEKQRKKRGSTDSEDGITNLLERIKGMTDQCVDGLMGELRGETEDEVDSSDEEVMKPYRTSGSKINSKTNTNSTKCLDTFMRDQIVIFQALGKLNRTHMENEISPDKEIDKHHHSDEKDISLHTQTAAWVCDRMLGVKDLIE